MKDGSHLFVGHGESIALPCSAARKQSCANLTLAALHVTAYSCRRAQAVVHFGWAVAHEYNPRQRLATGCRNGRSP
jgi:hypothetical protein